MATTIKTWVVLSLPTTSNAPITAGDLALATSKAAVMRTAVDCKTAYKAAVQAFGDVSERIVCLRLATPELRNYTKHRAAMDADAGWIGFQPNPEVLGYASASKRAQRLVEMEIAA